MWSSVRRPAAESIILIQKFNRAKMVAKLVRFGGFTAGLPHRSPSQSSFTGLVGRAKVLAASWLPNLKTKSEFVIPVHLLIMDYLLSFRASKLESKRVAGREESHRPKREEEREVYRKKFRAAAPINRLY